MPAPSSHISESLKLEPDGIVFLYEIRMRNNGGIVRLKDSETRTWQGLLWESCPIQITGDDQTAEGSDTRPKLTVVNPYGLFTPFVMNGVLEYAIVIRKAVLHSNLIADVNIYEQRMWRVRRVVQLIGGQSITVELMNMSEGPAFMIPVRQFIPPDFPTVTLT
jgi:phage-related protein